MIAVNCEEGTLYGCPNCGCDTWVLDTSFKADQPAGTCVSCGTHYQIFANGIKKSSVGFGTNKYDKNGNEIFEYPVLIPHPRKGIMSWNWGTSVKN